MTLCCEKPVKAYTKSYGIGGFEMGFRCKKCGRIRIPVNDLDGSAYERQCAALREKAIKEDEGDFATLLREVIQLRGVLRECVALQNREPRSQSTQLQALAG